MNDRLSVPASGPTAVDSARPEDVPDIARLHLHGLEDGFLTSLGPRFLAGLYRAMISSPHAVVLVARDGSEVIGFAAGAVSPGAFWRDFIRRRFLGIGAALAVRAIRPTVARGILEVARHIKEERASGPELLSIVVGPSSRRGGLGSHLVMKMEEELRQRGCQKVAVAVRSDNRWARDFFARLGFHALGQVEVHQGQPSLRYERWL
jgi:ribosomal protein S18 acetylase RimI-like enzyme